MRVTKIKIRNLFGISEKELDGRSVELAGTNGSGKTSVIDSIRYALTNGSDRDCVVRKGEKEGEIIVETDTGLYINRKKRSEQADYKSVKECGRDIQSPESFLKQLFTPLQLDPVAFTQMSKKEQNRAILDLIDFKWDLNWIAEKFGEIPQNIDYGQNILQVLADIQSEDGYYFKTRQDINRNIRNQRAFITDIAKDIPSDFDAEKWASFDLSELYKKLAEIKEHNSRIQRAKLFKESYGNKLRGLQGEKEKAIAAEKLATANERESLVKAIERMTTELNALDDALNNKLAVIEARYNESVAKLDSDTRTADKYADKEPIDTLPIESLAAEAEEMKGHINEYNRMRNMQSELEALTNASNKLTEKIELARSLPGEILKTATIPVKGMTVENGTPLINGLPISNLSEGEQLELCVDVALAKPNGLQIILLDGVERLSSDNRSKLYAKCKEKGVQFIATRTTDSSEMEVTYL